MLYLVQFSHLAPRGDLAATPTPPDLRKALLVTLRIGANCSSPRVSLHLHQLLVQSVVFASVLAVC